MGLTVDQIAALDPRKNDRATSYPRGTNHPGVELCHQRSGQDRLRANGFIDRHVSTTSFGMPSLTLWPAGAKTPDLAPNQKGMPNRIPSNT